MEPVISFKAKDVEDASTETPGADAPRKSTQVDGEIAKGEMPGGPAEKPPRSATEVSARPGESDPAKTMREAGEGRQAASGRVKPGTTPKDDEPG